VSVIAATLGILAICFAVAAIEAAVFIVAVSAIGFLMWGRGRN
jgi:hypothetical protein